MKRHHVAVRFRIWPEAEEIEPAMSRGELRLAAEALLAHGRGQLVPVWLQERAAATIHAMAGAQRGSSLTNS